MVPAATDRDRIGGRISEITQALAAAPKTVGWQMRARIGRRKRWYQVPEEVTR
jgi:hypothetical protein